MDSGGEGRGLQHPWARSVGEVLEAVGSLKEGLTREEAQRRLEAEGPNELRNFERRGKWSIFIAQLKSMVIALLVVAMIVSTFFGDYVEAAAIGAVVVINTLIGFFTELRAVRSMEALREFEEIEAKVIRGGEAERISARDIVRGDVVMLDPGRLIPADLRLIEVSELEVDESALTGESVPVEKRVEEVGAQTPLAEQVNMSFKGCAVTRGKGQGVVVGTGMETEIGEIAGMIAAAGSEDTPLEERLDKLATRLVWLTMMVAVMVAAMGLVAGRDTFLMIQTAVALAVAAIPEGLAIVATVALARGMWRMVDHHALMRRLSSVETLGSTNVICTDKTGTLTENKMMLRRVEFGERVIELDEGLKGLDLEDAAVRRFLKTAVLATDASLREGDHQEESGDPMDRALLRVGRRIGMSYEEIHDAHPQERLTSFSRESGMMASYHRKMGGYFIAIKGSPEAVLAASTTHWGEQGKEELDEEERGRWKGRSEEAAKGGYRMLALATREVSEAEGEPYEELEFLGLLGFIDPPRGDVSVAVERCRSAGIQVVMVTGDHPGTAEHVAREVRLVDGDGNAVLLGRELEEIEHRGEEERERLLGTAIFARVSPRQKLNLIGLHQSAGRIVAMTGDGVNDAPALKKADIGIAMGERGTAVAKEAAEMVLLDDDFATIVAAIEQGRVIFNNIRRFVVYLLSGNVGEILAVTAAVSLGYALPLLPLQILYLNMINDVFPALALGIGEGDKHVMEGAPRDPEEPFLRKVEWGAIGAYGVVIGGTILGSFLTASMGFGIGYEEAVTIAFLTLSLSRLWHVFNMRDAASGVFDNDVVGNRWVWGAIVLSLGLLGGAIWFKPLAEILEVVVPSAVGWAIIGVGSVVPLVVGQIYLLVRKLIAR